MRASLSRLAGTVAGVLAGIPFPALLRPVLRDISAWLRRRHRLLPIALAVVVAYLGAEATLWLARQPLIYGWRLFGWLAGHRPARLAYYHALAHLAAFLVAAKLVFELRPVEGRLR